MSRSVESNGISDRMETVGQRIGMRLVGFGELSLTVEPQPSCKSSGNVSLAHLRNGVFGTGDNVSILGAARFLGFFLFSSTPPLASPALSHHPQFYFRTSHQFSSTLGLFPNLHRQYSRHKYETHPSNFQHGRQPRQRDAGRSQEIDKEPSVGRRARHLTPCFAEGGEKCCQPRHWA